MQPLRHRKKIPSVFLLGTLLGAATSSLAQTAPAKAATASIPVTALADEKSEVTVLSPFEVNTAGDRGYFSSSTMSGTRLNSKLEDLAASISVVSKEQLLDFASADINDVFKYEASTEGIYQYTSFGLDRGVISDNVTNEPQGATRVRGLTAANIASNGFGTTLPIDTYNVDSIEISRGPNSSVFGLGTTGGGVNINLTRANLTREVTTFKTQLDSYDGYRSNFDVNRPLVKNQLAIRVLGLYEEKGYVRKPSADTTRRLNAMITLHPYKNTTIRGSFESYRNYNSRPNSTTPRDMVNDWIASGKPTWNPITQTVNFGNGAASITGITTNLEATLLPAGLTPSDSALQTFPSFYIDQGQVQLYMINKMPTATGTGPNSISTLTNAGRLLQNGNFYTKNSATYPLYTPAGISDRSLYDWTSVSLTGPNWQRIKGETTLLDLEQIFVRTKRQSLVFQASYLKERVSTNTRSFLGNGTNTQVFVDINEKLLDGSVNPYFLRPYIGGSQPIFSKARSNTDNYRGTLAYQLDLTKESGWLRWFGKHNFSGFSEYRSIYGGKLGYRDTMSSIESWMSTATPPTAPASRNSASYRTYPHYYVGDTTGGNIDYAPQRLATDNASQTLRYYNGVTGQWINESVDFSEYAYANRLNKRLLSTYGGNWQGFFWDGRIVPNFGARHDYNRTRDGNNAINPTVATNGFYDTSDMQNFGTYDWVGGDGNTTNAGIVVKPLSWLNLTYSQSNSFSPGSLAYNVYGVALGDPKGKTKDYGFSLALFPGKDGRPRLNITAKQYETTDFGRGTSEINTIVQRAIRLDADGNGTGGDPDLESFYTIELAKAHPAWTVLELEAEATKLMGVDAAFIDGHRNKTHGDTGDAVSKGKEIEIAYNPNRNWTLKATIVQATALNAIMSPDLQKYVADRLPVWQAAVSPFNGLRFWKNDSPNANYYVVGGRTPESWYYLNLLAPMKLAVATQGKPRNQTREWRVNMVTKYKFAGATDNRWLKPLEIGGSIRWEDKAGIGYLAGPADINDNVVRELDSNKPVYDKARYYADFLAAYTLHFANDKVRCRLQLNVKNVFENGRLQAIAVNPDGKPYAYRIIDPRQFVFSATFDL